MAVNAQIEIPITGDRRLYFNFVGLDAADQVDPASLRLRLYAIGPPPDHKQIFDAELDLSAARQILTHLDAVDAVRNAAAAGPTRLLEIPGAGGLARVIEMARIVDPRVLEIVLSRLTADQRRAVLITQLTDAEVDSISAARKKRGFEVALHALELAIEIDASGRSLVDASRADDLLRPYEARQPETVFQRWFEKNYWALGVAYAKLVDGRSIALDARADLLMVSFDGFLDLIELKRPVAQVFAYDDSHKSYYPHKDLACAIGQSCGYLRKLDEYQLQVAKEYGVPVLRPRVRIIAGRSQDFDEAKVEALRMLNATLSGVEVMTFDHVVGLARTLLRHFDEEPRAAASTPPAPSS